jgi:hypothetical protein
MNNCCLKDRKSEEEEKTLIPDFKGSVPLLKAKKVG